MNVHAIKSKYSYVNKVNIIEMNENRHGEDSLFSAAHIRKKPEFFNLKFSQFVAKEILTVSVGKI